MSLKTKLQRIAATHARHAATRARMEAYRSAITARPPAPRDVAALAMRAADEAYAQAQADARFAHADALARAFGPPLPSSLPSRADYRPVVVTLAGSTYSTNPTAEDYVPPRAMTAAEVERFYGRMP
jgi:hypothetical protein